MRNIITYDGKSSMDFGLYVGLNQNDNAPQRSTEDIVVPGRNGTLTIDNGRYENIDVSYICFIRYRFEDTIPAARNFFLANSGYRRLEDSAHPEEYRMAKYKSGLEVTPSQMRKQGYFTLTFNCMPQRFLKSGEIPLVFTGNGTIFNETMQVAKPLIRVWGNGSLGIGENTITLAGITDPYTDIDCESMDAYAAGENRNSNISGAFPVLEPGPNGVSLSGVTKVEITPRWWIL